MDTKHYVNGLLYSVVHIDVDPDQPTKDEVNALIDYIKFDMPLPLEPRDKFFQIKRVTNWLSKNLDLFY